MLSWGLYRNLENSLCDFLNAQAITDGATSINGDTISTRVGRKFENDWSLPCISIYVDSETAPRLEIGSNVRQDSQLMVIDIFATNEGERLDIANWVVNSINNGFPYYTYYFNASDPETPTKVAGRLTHIDFISNNRVNLGQTVDEIDNHRHKITVNVFTTGV